MIAGYVPCSDAILEEYLPHGIGAYIEVVFETAAPFLIDTVVLKALKIFHGEVI
jgi:hypothetical protein